MSQKAGRQSVLLDPSPYLTSAAAVVGPMEGKGPLGEDFDLVYPDLRIKEKSFEAAERKMLQEACLLALKKQDLRLGDIDYFLAGDLLNQITVSGYSAAALGIPFFGLYGACSTLTLALSWGAMLVAGGFAQKVLAATSSHNCSAERQYRYPTEYGFQRPRQAQWTVTGAAAAVIGAAGEGPRITAATIGKVVDMGEKDAYGLGAAMAPAAASTLIRHFEDLQRRPDYYDLIVTGDLGQIGAALLRKLLARSGYCLEDNYNDCGLMIYNPELQDVGAGGSGCACSGVVVLGHLYRRMKEGELKRILVVSTGALHSPTTLGQGESIPGVAHAVALEI
ncbi:MAG: stage V sporulation protein AD [Firmicutes bacterium]|jgi:stage V sporulation protein AD|nr:stage V sporulation protein AD [Bacillota bacterium]HPU00303.1 stage V sporulation protein AD [Bacillota bacterium]